MWYWNLVYLFVGVLIGASAMLFYYRRNSTKVEASLEKAKKAREKAEEYLLALKKKIGG
jgi:uncharacterized membrane-anchored protein YhcB (DUF1043 family)